MLRDKIQKQATELIKKGDKKKAQVLRYLYSQIKDKEIDQGRKELTDKEVLKLIQKQIKSLKEEIKIFEKEDRQKLLDKAKYEIEVLAEYLPEQLSADEIGKKIEDIIENNPNIDKPGPMIGKVIQELGGEADNSQIARIVQEKFRQD